METKLNITSIQYINLFWFITGVRATDCFEYGSSTVFVVKPGLVFKAVGKDGGNVKRLSEKIRKKVKVISLPLQHTTDDDIAKFILALTYPIHFKKLTRDKDGVTIAAGPQAKAQLIGRNSARLNELRNILRKYFKIRRIRIK